MPASPSSAVKTISKKSRPITPASSADAVKKVLQQPRFKDLSFSFRGECMSDVGSVFAALLKDDDASLSLCHYSAKTTAHLPGVDGIVVFRLYDGMMDRFVRSIESSLDVMGQLDGDVHVINETLNFTTDYDGNRTYTGEQRDTLMDHLNEKLADISFSDVAV